MQPIIQFPIKLLLLSGHLTSAQSKMIKKNKSCTYIKTYICFSTIPVWTALANLFLQYNYRSLNEKHVTVYSWQGQIRRVWFAHSILPFPLFWLRCTKRLSGGVTVTRSWGTPHGGGGSDPWGTFLGFGVWWISVPTRQSKCWSVTAMWLLGLSGLNESFICSIKRHRFAKMKAFGKTVRGWEVRAVIVSNIRPWMPYLPSSVPTPQVLSCSRLVLSCGLKKGKKKPFFNPKQDIHSFVQAKYPALRIRTALGWREVTNGQIISLSQGQNDKLLFPIAITTLASGEFPIKLHVLGLWDEAREPEENSHRHRRT